MPGISNKANRRCARCVDIASWVGLWDSVFLAVFKGVVGMATKSHALTASALYSIHDVVSGAAILIGLKISAKPADQEHPYGHGNVEYIVCAFTSILILMATVFLITDSVKLLLKGQHAPSHWAALAAAVISVFANEAIYRFNICSSKHMNSPALLAHAKHHRADALSSLAVVIAIVGSMMGYRYLDALVAVVEAGHLIILSAEILYHGGSGLIDRAIEESDVAVIQQILSRTPDVTCVENIKTRQIGRSVWVDIYVSLPVDKTIAEVDMVSQRIREGIEKRIRHVGNINVMYV
ncbi:cation diffusion facilitator family transporter [Verrucomicrobiota bacterium]